MPPDWLKHSAKLAADSDLRLLQLRWARDDIWMRRVIFVIAVLVIVASIVYLLLEPSHGATGVATVTTLLGLPIAYFFGWRKKG